MDTVLGLSLTSTTLGWALLDADDTTGVPLSGEELGLARHGGGDAGSVSAYAAAIVARLQPVLTAADLRINGIGLAAAADAAATAALVRENLIGAGFPNVTALRPSDSPVPARRAALAPLAVWRFPTLDEESVHLDVADIAAAPARRLTYAGAVTMLAAGAMTLVVSLSVMLSPHLGPAAVPTDARAAGPATAPAADQGPQPPLELPEAPTPMAALWERPPAEAAPAEPPVAGPAPSGPRSLLDRVREKMPQLGGH